MTNSDLAARGQRASLFDEFARPILDDMKAEYIARLEEVATTELNSAKRADKITALSVALKVLKNLDAGLVSAIRDGELAQKKLARADEIERMSAPQRRIFDIAGY